MKREPYVSEANIRPAFLDMAEVKRYRFFTRFMKVCPNGEVYYECFMNDEVDDAIEITAWKPIGEPWKGEQK